MPPPAGTIGAGREQCFSNWLLPDTDSRIGKGRTGPIATRGASIISYITEPGDSVGKFRGPESRVASGIDDNFSGGTAERYLQTIQNIAAQDAFTADKVRLQSAGRLLPVQQCPDLKCDVAAEAPATPLINPCTPKLGAS